MRYLLILQSVNWINSTEWRCLDLSPFQNTRETKPMIADTQFPAARNSFQTNNTVGRLIIVIRDTFCRFCVFSAFLQPRHRLSIYELLFQNGALFGRAKWLASSAINYGFWLVNIFEGSSTNHNCGTRSRWEPGTRHGCWYYPLARNSRLLDGNFSLKTWLMLAVW